MRVQMVWLLARLIVCGVAVSVSSGAAMADGLRIYAAGSLSAAFSEMIAAFPGGAAGIAPPVFGPAGVLREKIENGAPADILASADMGQPRRLARGHPERLVIMFTRNRICALGREKLGLTTDNLLDRLLDPSVRMATSTPGADPAGDYTWAMFDKAETIHPGAGAALRGKALKLMGGPETKPLVPGHDVISGMFLANEADVLLGYCSGFAAVMREVPGLVSVSVPAPLSVGVAYGMVILTDHPRAADFALFVMSEQGQAILGRNGFDPVGLTAP